ncbi:MAG TPA: peptidoglycan-binding protein [Candidatus Limiplasma sp.]|nr:peptidoglycan-binding protein [Candidatus Limiplasma sp.]
MATKITNAALKAACEQMLTEDIPYTTLDCQAAVEEALLRTGVPLSECNLSGSNAHYRNCLWRGTPERMLDLLGVKEVPAGMFVFIVLASGEPAKYQGDGYGNADHMGIYLGGGRTFNSSSSRGGVEVSTKFNGRTAVPNGGWNMIGWSPWVDCGLTSEQVAALKGDANYTDSDTGTQSTSESVVTPTVDAVTDTSGYYLIKKGCKGGAVERLQTWLARDLGYGINVDHDFGPATEVAVIAFQTAHGLEADGVVGRLTWAALAEARYNAHKNGISG